MTQLSLEESQRWCHQLMRAVAANFYYGMSILPAPKRNAMFALYAFMRQVDDIADDGVDAGLDYAVIQQQLVSFRSRTHAALRGDTFGHPLFPALAHAVARFCIPVDLLDAAVDGQLQDLRQVRYQSFEELRQYCYRVASTVGIAAVFIWGFRDSRAIEYADERGVAFQLTNILRDLREDWARGRVYLPAEEMARFGVDLSAALQGRQLAPFAEMMQFQVARAQEFYASSAPLETLLPPDSRATLRVMTAIYRGILDEIAADPLAVLHRRVGLSASAKLRAVAKQIWAAQLEQIRVSDAG